MKKIILSILVIFGVSVASLGNADERVKLLGLSVGMKPVDALEHLIDLGLQCETDGAKTVEELSKKYGRYITCWGPADFSRVYEWNDYEPVVTIMHTPIGLYEVYIHCGTFDFCSIYTYDTITEIAEELVADGVVPHLNMRLSEIRFVVSSKRVMNKEVKKQPLGIFVVPDGKTRVTDTNSITVADYCYVNTKLEEELCVMPIPESKYAWYDPAYGPAIIMKKPAPVDKRDWNPQQLEYRRMIRTDRDN